MQRSSGPIRLHQQLGGFLGLTGIGEQHILAPAQRRSVRDHDGVLGADIKAAGQHEAWTPLWLRGALLLHRRLESSLDPGPVRNALEAFLADQDGRASGANGDDG
jgi:hypothetical protein